MFYFLFSLLSFLSISLSSQSYINTYKDFLIKYNKSFHIDNFNTFQENLLYVQDHNNQNHSYQLTMNHLSDTNMSFEDNLYKINNSSELEDSFSNNIHLQLDWRKKDILTDVKDQGRCGSCWSFSATGAMEALHALSTGELLNISEQQLMDCSIDYGNKGCHGGMMDNAFKYVIDNGICSEKEYPYTGQQGFCSPCNTVLHIDNYKDITPYDEKLLKRAVAQQPVSIAIQANLKSFQLYSSGIYSDPDCGTNIDHGVLLVGYGFDLFHKMDYWIIKNSWGPYWGENGYIRIQRNIENASGLCGITLQPSIPTLN